MARKIFISHNFTAPALTRSLPRVQRNLFGLHKGDFLFLEDGNLPTEACEAQLRPLLDQADAVILLYGDTAHSSPLIEREIELATARNLLILGARIEGTTDAPPARLRYWKKFREVKLIGETLEAAILKLAKGI